MGNPPNPPGSRVCSECGAKMVSLGNGNIICSSLYKFEIMNPKQPVDHSMLKKVNDGADK